MQAESIEACYAIKINTNYKGNTLPAKHNNDEEKNERRRRLRFWLTARHLYCAKQLYLVASVRVSVCLSVRVKTEQLLVRS